NIPTGQVIPVMAPVNDGGGGQSTLGGRDQARCVRDLHCLVVRLAALRLKVSVPIVATDVRVQIDELPFIYDAVIECFQAVLHTRVAQEVSCKARFRILAQYIDQVVQQSTANAVGIG